jgi:hypothetical protein
MRKQINRIGWVILSVLPIAFTAEGLYQQDLPAVQPWKWAIAAAAVLLIFVSRNRDDVLKHHLA